ncbi:YoaK family protein [Mesorhizobium sp. BE184]|uniref:YoaK family protein n=1 Tax=Mesorhizobium sp. BE184 TaxID=2817714 RepID=UPI00285C3839|nr:YoaK family protein [Mesorhizobium sp. BE184]MDR7032717.1 uncharacterized membrane protein YoaK (UPF0700 family) [Mesorhizobium sp. BE184]
MRRLPPHFRFMAACLSFVAGFVDALGFLSLGGYFVSFMSGNSTRLAVGVWESLAQAAMPAGLIALFVLGVTVGTLLSRRATGAQGRSILRAIAALVATAAAIAGLGYDRAAILLVPIAMGALNTIFQRDGEVSVGVTYMTGTLVKFGQYLAAALAGGDRWGWSPYLLLWAGLIVGSICGAAAYPLFGLNALWLPALALATLSLAWREPVLTAQ